MIQLGLGCVRLGSVTARLGWRESVRFVQHAVDRGVSWFDTADAYANGTSEQLLGQALRGRRDAVTIATKGGFVFRERPPLVARGRLMAARAMAGRLSSGSAGAAVATRAGGSSYEAQDFSPAHLGAALDRSLRRLRTDRVDVYQLHGFGRDDADAAPHLVDAVAAWAERAIAAGKIGRLGLAAETLEQAALWTRSERFESVQLPFGILDPHAGESLIPELHRSGRLVIARGVLGAGLLTAPAPSGDPKAELVGRLRRLADSTGVAAAQLGVWYVRARTDIDTVLVGASSANHLDDIVSWFRTPLPSADVIGALDAVARDRGSSDAR